MAVPLVFMISLIPIVNPWSGPLCSRGTLCKATVVHARLRRPIGCLLLYLYIHHSAGVCNYKAGRLLQGQPTILTPI